MFRNATQNYILGSTANVEGFAVSDGHHSLSHPMPSFSGKMAKCDASLELIGVEKMHESLAPMDQWDGLALSQQLSQVCLRTPWHHHHTQQGEPKSNDGRVEVMGGNGDEGVSLADQENPSDYICSQDFFCTPDFITPVDQQFAIDLDNKGNSGCSRSPRGLTPLRVKRPRSDTIQTLPAWLDDDNSSEQLLEDTSLSESPSLPDDNKVLGISSMGNKSHSTNTPNSRGKLASMRRRVQSPDCLRNPFLEDNADILQKLNSQWRALMPSTNPLLGQNSFSRYQEDFHELQEIGRGNFSRVYKVLKRIDGCLYAVKRSQHALRITSERKQAPTEVQALAAVGAHKNIVRYYTAWFESDFCYIQMELCDTTLTQLRESDPNIAKECSLLKILRQVLNALSRIHSKGLVHLDVKPDNIYVLNGVYKLGDFGRATRADGSLSIEEGDARYIALEIINDDYSQLPKVDMFALGATIYEMARGSPLPSSGSQYQSLRQGKISLLPGCSLPFQNILKEFWPGVGCLDTTPSMFGQCRLKSLLHPMAKLRPTADELLKNSIFNRDDSPELSITDVST